MTGVYRKLFEAGGRLPTPAKRGVKAAYYYSRWRFKEKDFIILNSIQKSGTNYFRRLMANYLVMYFERRDEPVTYDEFHSKLFPNVRDAYLEGYKKYVSPHPIMASTPYADFVYGHKPTFLEHCPGRIIFLYRNPLDNIVSMYFFRYKNRPERENLYNHPREVIDLVLPNFMYRYTLARDISRRKPNLLRVPYELLVREPFETLHLVLNYLGLPIDVATIAKVVEASSFNAVRKEEEMRETPMHAPEGFKEFFTRSGKIGEWKDYFEEADVKKIASKLANNGIELGEFILE